MNSRRSFFKRLGAAIAVVALAPELCFGELKVTEKTRESLKAFWIQTSRWSMCVDENYLKYMETIATKAMVKIG